MLLQTFLIIQCSKYHDFVLRIESIQREDLESTLMELALHKWQALFIWFLDDRMLLLIPRGLEFFTDIGIYCPGMYNSTVPVQNGIDLVLDVIHVCREFCWCI